MYWLARQKCVANLRASESSDAKASVPKDWNSSMWTKNGTRFSGAWSLRPWRRVADARASSEPSRFAACSPICPLARLAMRMPRWSIAWARSNFGACWPKNGAQRRRGGELADLVENGTGRLGAIALVVAAGTPLSRNAAIDRIADASDDAGAEILVGIEPRQVDERRPRRRKERGDAVKKKMLKPRSPALAATGA